MLSDAAERDPSLGLEVSVANFGVGVSTERSTPPTSRVLFPEEDVKVEEVPQSPESLPSCLSSNYLFSIEYIRPESERPESPYPSHSYL